MGKITADKLNTSIEIPNKDSGHPPALSDQRQGEMAAARTPATLRWLVASSYAYILISLIATGIMVAENRPAAFGGSSSGLPALQDFLYGNGTAMSPPLYWLVAQFGLTILASRRRRWGVAGVFGLALFGLLSGIGALGEPILLDIFSPATFDPLKAVVETGMIILPFSMLVCGVLEMLRRRGAQVQPQA